MGFGTAVGIGATLAGRLIPNFRTWYMRNKDTDEVIQGQFEPDSTTRDAGANWTETSTLNRQHAVLSFLNGKQERVSIGSRFYRRDALDTSPAERINKLISWTKRDAKLGRPPIIQFWIGGQLSQLGGAIGGAVLGGAGAALTGADVKTSVGAAIAGAFAGQAEEHINMDVVIDSVAGISYGPPDFFGGVREVQFTLNLIQFTTLSLDDKGVFDTRYHRARERDYYELLTVQEYGNPLLGDVIRHRHPEQLILKPGDIIKLPAIEGLRNEVVTPKSHVLVTAYGRRDTPQRRLRQEYFSRDYRAVSFLSALKKLSVSGAPRISTDIFRVISDVISVTDRADWGYVLKDTISLTEHLYLAGRVKYTLPTDAAIVVDIVALAKSFARKPIDTVSVTDLARRSATYGRKPVDTVSVAELMVKSAFYHRKAQDTVAVTDEVVAVLTPLGFGSSLKLDVIASKIFLTEVSGAISAWKDISGEGNDISQSTPSERPVLEASGFNGKPTVRFAKASSQSLGRTGGSAATAPSGNDQPYTAVFVAQSLDHQSGGVLLHWINSADNDSSIRLMVPRLSQRFIELHRVDDAGTGAAPLTTVPVDIGLHTYYFEFTGTVISLWVDEESIPWSSGANVGTLTTDIINIGAAGQGGTSLYWDGRISRAMVWNANFNATDRAKIHDQCRRMFGLPKQRSPKDEIVVTDSVVVVFGLPDTASLLVDFVVDSMLVLLDSGNVSQWRPLLGTGNFTQGNPADQPLFEASGMNGKPSIRFDKADAEYMAGSSGFISAAFNGFDATYTLAMVVQALRYGDNGSIFTVYDFSDADDAIEHSAGAITGTKYRYYREDTTSGKVTVNASEDADQDIHILYWQFTGTTISLWVDNQETSIQGAAADVSLLDGQGVYIGQDRNAIGNFWDGRIARIALWSEVLSSAARTATYEAMRKTLGLPRQRKSADDIEVEDVVLAVLAPPGFGSSLKLDLIASEITWTVVSNAVSVWRDLSGNANDFSQGTASNRPIPESVALNGRPAVRFFEAESDHLAAGGAISTMPSGSDVAYSVAFVAQALKYSSGGCVIGWHHTTGTGAIRHLHSAEGAATVHQSSRVDDASTAVNVNSSEDVDKDIHVYYWEFTGTTVSLWIDNQATSIAAIAQNVGTLTTNVVRLGAGVGFLWEGRLGRLLAWNTTLSSTDRTKAYEQLRRQYGLPVQRKNQDDIATTDSVSRVLS